MKLHNLARKQWCGVPPPPRGWPVPDADLTPERRFFLHATESSYNCAELTRQDGNEGNVVRGRMKSGSEMSHLEK